MMDSESKKTYIVASKVFPPHYKHVGTSSSDGESDGEKIRFSLDIFAVDHVSVIKEFLLSLYVHICLVPVHEFGAFEALFCHITFTNDNRNVDGHSFDILLSEAQNYLLEFSGVQQALKKKEVPEGILETSDYLAEDKSMHDRDEHGQLGVCYLLVYTRHSYFTFLAISSGHQTGGSKDDFSQRGNGEKPLVPD
ncbi:hypothetical protein DFH11DRAFT_1816094 [Phellopilus nigrolimitatus]|nr:hypothetical protein DFH11DRAFT_1816094 [Phellopilus nigrolimitatus]